MFLKAEPQTTGNSLMRTVAKRIAALSSSIVGVSPATYFSNRVSSPASWAASATFSIITSRQCLASARSSAGISTSSNSAPSDSLR